MNKDGLAVAPAGTTPAPKGMYVEAEENENIAKGYVQVKELIAYDKIGEKKNDVGKVTDVEKSRKPCFCQTSEDERIYKENNPKPRIETFSIQLLKSTAIKYLNDPENVKQFKERDNG
jgi:hypothetical protein